MLYKLRHIKIHHLNLEYPPNYLFSLLLHCYCLVLYLIYKLHQLHPDIYNYEILDTQSIFCIFNIRFVSIN